MEGRIKLNEIAIVAIEKMSLDVLTVQNVENYKSDYVKIESGQYMLECMCFSYIRI